MVLTDTAHYQRAIEELSRSLRLSHDAGDGTQTAFTLAMLGRAHLLRDELEPAAAAFDESLARARSDNWTAFIPWPEALRGDVDLATGATDTAVERYEHAFALACQLGDPCWEGIAARGIGRAAAARDEIDKALEWLMEARTRCVRLPDAWLWIEAYTLDALCVARRRAPAAGRAGLDRGTGRARRAHGNAPVRRHRQHLPQPTRRRRRAHGRAAASRRDREPRAVNHARGSADRHGDPWRREPQARRSDGVAMTASQKRA